MEAIQPIVDDPPSDFLQPQPPSSAFVASTSSDSASDGLLKKPKCSSSDESQTSIAVQENQEIGEDDLGSVKDVVLEIGGKECLLVDEEDMGLGKSEMGFSGVPEYDEVHEILGSDLALSELGFSGNQEFDAVCKSSSSNLVKSELGISGNQEFDEVHKRLGSEWTMSELGFPGNQELALSELGFSGNQEFGEVHKSSSSDFAKSELGFSGTQECDEVNKSLSSELAKSELALAKSELGFSGTQELDEVHKRLSSELAKSVLGFSGTQEFDAHESLGADLAKSELGFSGTQEFDGGLESLGADLAKSELGFSATQEFDGSRESLGADMAKSELGVSGAQQVDEVHKRSSELAKSELGFSGTQELDGGHESLGADFASGFGVGGGKDISDDSHRISPSLVLRTMASISQREGSSKEVQLILDKEDRISNLPESILVYILSLLPMKYTVRTCVLSSRWKHLWAIVPNLDFDGDLYPDLSASDFMNIVDQVLFSHESCYLQKFRFRCFLDAKDLPRIHSWICYAIKCGIKELDIEADLADADDKEERRLSFPLSIFNCPTLVTLKLGHLITFRVPKWVHLKSLKVLHVSLCAMDDLTQNLFSNCPVLEDLIIAGLVSADENFIIDVSVASLKRFKFDISGGIDGADNRNQIVLNAPILEYLTVEDDYVACYVPTHLISLVKAEINVGYYCNRKSSKHQAHRLVVLLRGIRNVKYLSLGRRTIGVLGCVEDYHIPMFHNLIHLDLCICNHHGWKRLLDFLNSMPNMLYLRLMKSKCAQNNEDNASADISCLEHVAVPSCLSLNLKEIKILGFWGLGNEMKLIEYLLRYSNVLQKMEICTSDLRWKLRKDFVDELLLFARGSTTCEILLSRKS